MNNTGDETPPGNANGWVEGDSPDIIHSDADFFFCKIFNQQNYSSPYTSFQEAVQQEIMINQVKRFLQIKESSNPWIICFIYQFQVVYSLIQLVHAGATFSGTMQFFDIQEV